MLITCPECDLQVSDKAFTCPHCGFPMKKEKPMKNLKPGFSRLPNGFGQITKITNKPLRKPYRVMVSVGKRDNGRPISKLLKPQAYFATYKEAYEALVEYNKNPYELDSEMTVQELYDQWSTEYFKTLKSESSTRTITSAWKYCNSVYSMRAKDLRARHIKEIMKKGTIQGVNGEDKTPTAGVAARIKSLFNLMLDYGVEYELVDKNYARTFDISDDIREEQEKTKRGHLSFTESEMNLLWSNLGMIPYLDLIIIQCYMGWRPQEMGHILLDNVNIIDGYIIGGMKTEAGTDRLVPIHPRIMDLVKSRYDESKSLNSPYLFTCTDGKTHLNNFRLTYDKYEYRFRKAIEAIGLNPDHRPHDPRKQFITMCKKYNVDEYAIKYMAGHAINDVTEAVYTDREIGWLKKELSKIK